MNQSIAMPRTRHCGSCICYRFVRNSGLWEITAVNSCSMFRCFTQMENRDLQAYLSNLGPHEPIPTECKTSTVIWKDAIKSGCCTSPIIIPHWFLLQVALFRFLRRLIRYVKFPCSPALVPRGTDTLICHFSWGLERASSVLCPCFLGVGIT